MIRLAVPGDAPRNLAIWRAAVAATHDFLAPEDLVSIDAMVAAWLPTADLWVHAGPDDASQGFMALSGAHVDALFVDPAVQGRGVGRALLLHARTPRRALTVDVNEQNSRGVGFYRRLGFEQTGRSPVDGQGRPYPLLHMAWPA